MKKKIGDIEYNIMPVPPHLSPYFTLLSNALKQTPSTVEEAEKYSIEVQKCLQKLFDECVNPKPLSEHTSQVYAALVDATNKALEEAGFFRMPKGPRPTKSNSTRPDTSQTPQ